MTGFSTGSSPTERLREMLRRSRHAVVFTGAGISTESGIPDYRGPGGIWSRFRPIEFNEFMTSEEARREYWRRKFDTHETVMQAKPNSGHRAIAELVRLRKAAAVITQNIDGLHQASGIPRAQVIELHGNTTYAHCLSCGAEFDLEPIRQAFPEDESLPECEVSGLRWRLLSTGDGQDAVLVMAKTLFALLASGSRRRNKGVVLRANLEGGQRAAGSDARRVGGAARKDAEASNIPLSSAFWAPNSA